MFTLWQKNVSFVACSALVRIESRVEGPWAAVKKCLFIATMLMLLAVDHYVLEAHTFFYKQSCSSTCVLLFC